MEKFAAFLVTQAKALFIRPEAKHTWECIFKVTDFGRYSDTYIAGE